MSDAEIVKEFLIESYENLDRLDRELIALENDPGNREVLASVFRTIHTIKGTSGFLAFNQLEAVTHVGENVLARLRDGQLALSPEITTALLSMVDAVRQMLGSIEIAGNEGQRHDLELIATLTSLLETTKKTDSAPARVHEEAPPNAVAPAGSNLEETLICGGRSKDADAVEAITQVNEEERRHACEILVEHGTTKPQDVVAAPNPSDRDRGKAPVTRPFALTWASWTG